MKKYSANLKLPFEFDMQKVIIADRHNLTANAHFTFAEKDLDPRLIPLMNEHGLTFSHLEVFHTPPYSMLAIHIDGSVPSNIVKMNFCYGAKGAKMMWWKLKAGREMKSLVTVVGTNYLYAEPGDCVMAESAVIGLPTLVNVGVPHSIMNNTPEHRWVLSCVLSNGAVDIQWDEAISRLAELLE